MAKSKLRLDTRRKLKDGTYPVQIAVGYGTNLYLATGIFLSADEWDSTTSRATGKSAKRTPVKEKKLAAGTVTVIR